MDSTRGVEGCIYHFQLPPSLHTGSWEAKRGIIWSSYSTLINRNTRVNNTYGYDGWQCLPWESWIYRKISRWYRIIETDEEDRVWTTKLTKEDNTTSVVGFRSVNGCIMHITDDGIMAKQLYGISRFSLICTEIIHDEHLHLQPSSVNRCTWYTKHGGIVMARHTWWKNISLCLRAITIEPQHHRWRTWSDRNRLI